MQEDPNKEDNKKDELEQLLDSIVLTTKQLFALEEKIINKFRE